AFTVSRPLGTPPSPGGTTGGGIRVGAEAGLGETTVPSRGGTAGTTCVRESAGRGSSGFPSRAATMVAGRATGTVAGLATGTVALRSVAPGLLPVSEGRAWTTVFWGPEPGRKSDRPSSENLRRVRHDG